MTDREGGNTEASRPNVIPYSDTNNTDTMNTKIVWIVVAILLLGAAFWFVTDYQKEGADDQQLSEGSTATDPNSVHNAGIRDPMMSGTWKSTEDAKFTREFEADGTITDKYEGDVEATTVGSWKVVDPNTEIKLPVPAINLAGMTVIKTEWGNGEVMYFSINTLTDTELEMTNLSGRGNILVFTKVK